MKNNKIRSLQIIRNGLIGVALTVGFSVFAQAGNNVVRVEGVKFSMSAPLSKNISMLKGKEVTIMLMSGSSITGKVKALNENLLHLEKLNRKEYFDALINVKNIIGIETRYRIHKNDLR